MAAACWCIISAMSGLEFSKNWRFQPCTKPIGGLGVKGGFVNKFVRTGDLGIGDSSASAAAPPSRPAHTGGLGVDDGFVSELARIGDLGIDGTSASAAAPPSGVLGRPGRLRRQARAYGQFKHRR